MRSWSSGLDVTRVKHSVPDRVAGRVRMAETSKSKSTEDLDDIKIQNQIRSDWRAEFKQYVSQQSSGDIG
jgi:hypothetical protein